MDEIKYWQTRLAVAKCYNLLFVVEDADGASGQHESILAKAYARKL
jgi:hypothetical protein